MEKLSSHGYDTDKSVQYLENYEEFFKSLRDMQIRLLELGIDKGGSLLLWRDYFKNGIIVGLDAKQVHVEDKTGRIRIYQGLQQDTALLDRIAKETAPAGFDIIIDDGSHIGELTSISFWHLFENHLKPGGLYCIEDWGTGYWDTFPDGSKYIQSHRASFFDKLMRRKRRFPSHDYGMVGFIKTLVDECGMADITKQNLGISPNRPSKFKKMQISHGQVIILKA